MVEPTFLVGLAVAFVLGLILILRQNASASEAEIKRVETKRQKAPKKPKGPQRNSLKKEKRPAEVREWIGVDSAVKDAQEMLEFLKGKDPVEIAKQLGQGKPKKKSVQAKKAARVDDSASEDSASEVVEDGFSKIVKKPKEKKGKKEEKKKKDEKKEEKRDKAFFKLEAEAKAEAEKKLGPKRERKPGDRPAAEGEFSERKRKERPEGERRERPEGERREKRERPEGEKGERPEGERREKPERPQRKPIPTVAPIVKYEQADLSDILDSITQDFEKPKPKINRVSSKFSTIPRNIVVSILSKVEARDLVALSRVNHYFSGVARKESLWRDVLARDFGLKDAGKYRNFRLAYKAEFKKRRAAAKRQKKEDEKVATEAAPAAAEEPKADDQVEKEAKPEKEAKQPKQKKDNKKKPADAPAED